MSHADIARLHSINLPIIHRALTVSAAQTCSAESMRGVMLNYLVHIGGIRDSLIDIERELWVLLQLTHDPRLTDATLPHMPTKAGCGPGQSRRAREALGDDFVPMPRQIAARRKKRSAEIRQAIRDGRPLPKHAQPAVIMPFRVLKALGKEETNAVPGYYDMTPAEREAKARASAALRAQQGKPHGPGKRK